MTALENVMMPSVYGSQGISEHECRARAAGAASSDSAWAIGSIMSHRGSRAASSNVSRSPAALVQPVLTVHCR